MPRCGCASDVCSCKIIAGPGLSVIGTGVAANPYQINGSIAERGRQLQMRTGAISETMPRVAFQGAYQTLVAGQMQLMAIPLTAGTVVTNIVFMSGSTAGASMTNQWFALYSPALAKIAVTNDALTAAWAANTEKSLALSAAYTIPTDGLYYIACMVAGTTPPSLLGATALNTVYGNLAPVLAARDTTNTGRTNPASAPATTTLAASASFLYAYVS